MSGDRVPLSGASLRSLPLDHRISRSVTRAGRIVFGDRVGVTVWLLSVLTLALWWRIGFFITDTYPIANAVVNLADGRLAMGPQDFQYSLTLGTQPGLHEYGGDFYARNYGQVVAAVPVLWALEAATFVGSPRLVLAAGWSAGVIVLGRQLAILLDRSWLRTAAAVVALCWFVAAVLSAMIFVAAVVTGVAVHIAFDLLGLIPDPASATVERISIELNYKAALNVLATVGFLGLYYLHRTGDDGGNGDHGGSGGHDGHAHGSD